MRATGVIFRALTSAPDKAQQWLGIERSELR